MSTVSRMEATLHPGLAARLLREAYGPGAWHGPDLKAALADVSPAEAFWRPAPGRHNIAEVALHHAFTVRNVRSKLSDAVPEPFVLAGEDWFVVDNERALAWSQVVATVDAEQVQLDQLVDRIDSGTAPSPLTAQERFELVLGITLHAVYHAGQIQLLKRLFEHPVR